MTPGFRIDLARYFSRIGFEGEVRPDPETFRALHRAHTTRVPFENLDVLLGRPIRLDLPALEAKIVGANRGGYCFEQNGLLTAVLEQIGFKVTRLAARIRFVPGRVVPLTHMLFLVDVEGERWIGDVGFGQSGLMEPIPLIAGEEYRQFGWTYALRTEGNEWVLRCDQFRLGPDQYAFNLHPQLFADYEMANHYTSTHQESRFVQTLTAQLSTPNGRLVLRNDEFVTVTPEGETSRVLQSSEELLDVLGETFGLHFPPGTTFGPAVRAMELRRGLR